MRARVFRSDFGDKVVEDIAKLLGKPVKRIGIRDNIVQINQASREEDKAFLKGAGIEIEWLL